MVNNIIKHKSKFRFEKPTGEVIDKERNLFKCIECGHSWFVDTRPGGLLPKDFNRCRNCDRN